MSPAPPNPSPPPPPPQVLRYFDYVFTGVFTFEMVIKVRGGPRGGAGWGSPPRHPLTPPAPPPPDGGFGAGASPRCLFPGPVEHSGLHRGQRGPGGLRLHVSPCGGVPGGPRWGGRGASHRGPPQLWVPPPAPPGLSCSAVSLDVRRRLLSVSPRPPRVPPASPRGPPAAQGRERDGVNPPRREQELLAKGSSLLVRGRNLLETVRNLLVKGGKPPSKG